MTDLELYYEAVADLTTNNEITFEEAEALMDEDVAETIIEKTVWDKDVMNNVEKDGFVDKAKKAYADKKEKLSRKSDMKAALKDKAIEDDVKNVYSGKNHLKKVLTSTKKNTDLRTKKIEELRAKDIDDMFNNPKYSKLTTREFNTEGKIHGLTYNTMQDDVDKSRETYKKIVTGATIAGVLTAIGVGAALSKSQTKALRKVVQAYEDANQKLKPVLTDLTIEKVKDQPGVVALIKYNDDTVVTIKSKTSVVVASKYTKHTAYYGACAALMCKTSNKYVKALTQLLRKSEVLKESVELDEE